MPILDHVISSGMSPFAATSVCGGVTSVTAAGTSIATGTLIGSGKTLITIVSSSGKALTLPSCAPGSSVFIYNAGANTASVYPNVSSEKINNLTAGNPFALAANKGVEINKMSATQWGGILTA